jgi:small basic protein
MRFWTGVLVFVIGLALGAVLSVMGPRVAGPYLPEAIRGRVETVEGEVMRKLREPDRLLITLATPRGAILAIFKKQIPEVDLLVDQGDTVTLGLRRFEPFVEDPTIQSVRKKKPAESLPGGPVEPRGN